MSTVNFVLIAVVAALAIIIVFLFMVLAFFKQIKEESKSVQEQIPQLVKRQFESEQAKMVTELETRKQAIESSVKGLEDELKEYKNLIREFEKDRDTKYGSLEAELKNASKNSMQLQDATNRLNDILGNVKLRGQWGERVAEDIISQSGLIEGVSFHKQKKLTDSSTKPDFTFLLPNDYILNMDVKFPLDNYLKMVNSKVDIEKEQFLKEFIKNVKERIKEIQSRDYINPSESTLDFVLLFIPNEQVFGFIQENVPGLMDESLKQKVVLCSPFTLYAMLRVIRQAYENFRFEKNLKKILKHIEIFFKYYNSFKTRFNEIGIFIENLEKKYDEIKNKNFKQIDAKIRHIDELKKGNGMIQFDSNEISDESQELSNDDIVV